MRTHRSQVPGPRLHHSDLKYQPASRLPDSRSQVTGVSSQPVGVRTKVSSLGLMSQVPGFRFYFLGLRVRVLGHSFQIQSPTSQVPTNRSLSRDPRSLATCRISQITVPRSEVRSNPRYQGRSQIPGRRCHISSLCLQFANPRSSRPQE